MKSINDKTTRDELIKRVNSLNGNHKAQWGSMNPQEMIMHCIQWEEAALGKKRYKRSFTGLLFGKLLLRSTTKDEKILAKNLPTMPEFIIKENNSDISAERSKWIALLEDHATLSEPDFAHPVFGKMTKEQLGRLSYKHNDHHLRQFGC